MGMFQKHQHLLTRIYELGLTQDEVAHAVGYEPSLLNRYLNGRRNPPPDFETKVKTALDKLEKAEKAAQEARERVLAEGA